MPNAELILVYDDEVVIHRGDLETLAGAAYTFHYQVHAPDRERHFRDCLENNCVKWRAVIEHHCFDGSPSDG